MPTIMSTQDSGTLQHKFMYKNKVKCTFFLSVYYYYIIPVWHNYHFIRILRPTKYEISKVDKCCEIA
jgi:hypothetical protein